MNIKYQIDDRTKQNVSKILLTKADLSYENVEIEIHMGFFRRFQEIPHNFQQKFSHFDKSVAIACVGFVVIDHYDH